LAHLAREPIDAVDEQQVETSLARERERLVQAGALERGARCLVVEAVHDAPVSIAWQ
jgi:hypothetical protein